MLTRILFGTVLLLGLAMVVGGPPSPDMPPATGISIDPPAEPAAAKLTVVLKDVQLDKVPLEKAVASIAKRAGLNVVINWETAHEELGVVRNTEVTLSLTDVSAHDALTAVLVYAGTTSSTFRITPVGSLALVGSARTNEFRGSVRVYDVADILQNERRRWRALHLRRPPSTSASRPTTGPADEESPFFDYEQDDKLMEFIKLHVGESDWKDWGGNTGSIDHFNGRLIITQTPENHRQVEKVLAMLRQTGEIPATSATTQPARQ